VEVNFVPNKAAKAALWSYQHDLEGWFSRFAEHLNKVHGGNPIARLMDADREINPYFITFALYWYLVPGLTLADRGLSDAGVALGRTRDAKKNLRLNAEALRWIAGFKFPPPWGKQLRELRTRSAPKSSRKRLTEIAAACEEGASLLELREVILNKMTSGKRKLRNAYVAVLWTAMTTKIGKGRAGSILTALIDCADEAFGNCPAWQEWETFELAAKRYREMFPRDFETRMGEVRRSRQRLPAHIAEMWRRLDSSDCKNIVDSLRPRFQKEVSRLRKA
jgi:hypothetical protein